MSLSLFLVSILFRTNVCFSGMIIRAEVEGGAVADIKKVIDSIMADPRLANSRAFSGRVYEDEPILRTGSQMKNYLPQRYKDMKALARPTHDGFDYHRPSETKLFYLQARFMENWEEDFPFMGTFNRYYPTYAMMNDQQLRGYFSWRTEVRRGNVRETSLSFAFVYVYELLNCVGGNPQECFDKLYAFWVAYREFTPELNRYLVSWMRDFVVYHNLPASLIESFIDTSFERSLIVLRNAEEAVDPRSVDVECLFDAMAVLSTYRVEKSAFFKEHRKDVQSVACKTFFDLCAHCAKHRKKGLVDSWFGSHSTSDHPMFQAAVFYEEVPHDDYLYRVNEVHAYSCRNGKWSGVRRYRSATRNAELGAVLATVDGLMRKAVSYGKPIKEHDLPKYLVKMIEANVESWLASVKDAERRRVFIDRSQLAGIRSRSAETREQLLVEEERSELPITENWQDESPATKVIESSRSNSESKEPLFVGGSEVPAVSSGIRSLDVQPSNVVHRGEVPDVGLCGPCGLSAMEISFISALFAKAGRAESCLGSESVDVVVDSINEKLFDLLGDTALEYGDSGVQIIEDYESDVKEALGL